MLSLISFSAFAEFEVTVTRDGKQTHKAVFDTESKADAWVQLHNHDNGAFGKPDKWVLEETATDEQKAFRGETRLREGCEVTEHQDCKEFFLAGDYTVLKTDITAQVQEEARLANVLAVGEKITDLCNSLSKMVVGYNYTRSLTALQIEEMTTTFSPIVTLVEGKRPFSAKPLIEAITPDGVVITEQMKSDLLNEYSKRGF